MENKELIINALNYYDKNCENTNNIFKNVEYYSFVISKNDLEHSVLIFYDNDKKKLFESRFEVISVFLPKVDIWVWGWSLPLIRKNQSGLIKKVLNYGLDLDQNHKLLKSSLTTSRLKVDNNIQLDINIAIASYISKSKTVLGISYDEHLQKTKEKILPFNVKLLDSTIASTYYSLLDI
jgi:hypothetical protein